MSALIVPFVSASSKISNAHLGANLCRFLKKVHDLPASFEIATSENAKRMLVVITKEDEAAIVAVTSALHGLSKRGFSFGDVAIAGPDRTINTVYGHAPQMN